MFILDDILLSPLKFTVWLAERLRDTAVQEMTDEAKVQEALLQLQMRLEMDEITQDAYDREETRLMENLGWIQQVKEEMGA